MADPTPGAEADAIQVWFDAHRPQTWAGAPLQLMVDNDEILVIVVLDERPTAVDGFREQSREERMHLAAAAEHRFGRKVSWGVRVGDEVATFTTASVPVMTRLRLPERRVLDTLIDAGVARSRSEALAWCVRLVGLNETEWIAELRATFAAVERVRARGPRSAASRRAEPPAS